MKNGLFVPRRSGGGSDGLVGAEPGPECPFCPRLVSLRQELRRSAPDWFNAPVPCFGDPEARLAIIGLAPGLRGANRTGRPFTGDWAGRLLYETLLDFQFARGTYDERPDDGLVLTDCLIVNAVRCVPPENKPSSAEINACRPFLQRRLELAPRLRAVLALGRVAHDSAIRALGGAPARARFAHGAEHRLNSPEGRGLVLFDSYHCSRYNTNTGVLTRDMFRAVASQIRSFLEN